MDALPASPFPLTAELPETLEFTGEFGAEVNSFVPFIHWLSQAGLMRGRRIPHLRGDGRVLFFPRSRPDRGKIRAAALRLAGRPAVLAADA